MTNRTSTDRPSNLPQLLRDAERRVNEHVWGDRRAIVSIPADVSRDVDILLLTAADEIEKTRADLELLSRAGCRVREHDGHRFAEIESKGDFS